MSVATEAIPIAARIERGEAMIALMRQGWALDNPAFRQILTSLFLPDANLEEMSWFNDLQRASASAENAARLMRSLGEFSVLDLLPGEADRGEPQQVVAQPTEGGILEDEVPGDAEGLAGRGREILGTARGHGGVPS